MTTRLAIGAVAGYATTQWYDDMLAVAAAVLCALVARFLIRD